MSLNFPVISSTDVVNHGRVAAVDNLTVFTLAIWVKPNTVAASDRRWFLKTNAAISTGGWFLGMRAADGTAPRINILYATANAVANANAGYLKANVWSFVVATFDGSAAPKIYVGYLNVSATEVSYSSTAAPSGAHKDDSANSIGVGNPYDANGANVSCADGEIAFAAISNVVLTIAEIQRLQRDSLAWVNKTTDVPYLRGVQFICHEGMPEMGKGLQRDWGPNGLHGAVVQSTGIKQNFGPYMPVANRTLSRLNQLVQAIKNRRTLGARVGSRMG